MKRCKFKVAKYPSDVEIRNSELEGQRVVIVARGTQKYKALTKRRLNIELFAYSATGYKAINNMKRKTATLSTQCI